MPSNKRQIYIAAADNMSKSKAYEYAKEFDFEIAGESGYIYDSVYDICENNIGTVVCSGNLFDGNAKDLHSLLVQQKQDVDVIVITQTQNKTFNLKQLDKRFLKSRQQTEYIERTLQKIGMPGHIKGYTLFKEALMITLVAPHALNSITGSVYKKLAESQNTNIRNVEFNMRKARDSSILNCDLETYYDIFGKTNVEKAPTVAEYLSSLTAYILRSY